MTDSVLVVAAATVADADAARRAHDLAGLGDTDALRASAQVRFQSRGHDSPPPHLRRLDAVASVADDGAEVRLICPEGDEPAQLAALAELVAGARRVVSWRGGAEEWPVIRNRAIWHGLSLPSLFRLGGGVADEELMPVFAPADGAGVALDEIAKQLRLPPPLSGEDVGGRAGAETAAVVAYLVDLRVRRARGEMEPAALAAAQGRIASLLERRPGDHWAGFRAALGAA